MKKNKLFSLLLISFIMGNCLLSCKKNTAEPKPDCKIIAAILGSDVTSFTYNADGKLNSQTNSEETKKFTHIDNAIIITSTTGSTANSITTVSLNADGLASNALKSQTGDVEDFGMPPIIFMLCGNIHMKAAAYLIFSIKFHSSFAKNKKILC